MYCFLIVIQPFSDSSQPINDNFGQVSSVADEEIIGRDPLDPPEMSSVADEEITSPIADGGCIMVSRDALDAPEMYVNSTKDSEG